MRFFKDGQKRKRPGGIARTSSEERKNKLFYKGPCFFIREDHPVIQEVLVLEIGEA